MATLHAQLLGFEAPKFFVGVPVDLVVKLDGANSSGASITSIHLFAVDTNVTEVFSHFQDNRWGQPASLLVITPAHPCSEHRFRIRFLKISSKQPSQRKKFAIAATIMVNHHDTTTPLAIEAIEVKVNCRRASKNQKVPPGKENPDGSLTQFPGIGHGIQERLEQKGVKRVIDLARLDQASVIRLCAEIRVDREQLQESTLLESWTRAKAACATLLENPSPSLSERTNSSGHLSRVEGTSSSTTSSLGVKSPTPQQRPIATATQQQRPTTTLAFTSSLSSMNALPSITATGLPTRRIAAPNHMPPSTSPNKHPPADGSSQMEETPTWMINLSDTGSATFFSASFVPAIPHDPTAAHQNSTENVGPCAAGQRSSCQDSHTNVCEDLERLNSADELSQPLDHARS